jgi:carnosine N-methyltransferase
MDKVYTTLKQFVRDWSAEGSAERERCYQPLLDEIDTRYAGQDHGTLSILVPGAGLGRLAWECAKRGFCCEGNEWSVYMLLGSNFVLNSANHAFHTPLHPFSHVYTNNRSVDDQAREVRIPDVDTFNLPATAKFSMAAGDFLEVYTEENKWDCVASSFFLDTARNIIVYLETIWKILKPGGVLINLGPLLYHFDDNLESPSIELCYDELRDIILTMGFLIVKEEYPIESPYIRNPASMMSLSYKCVFLVIQKPDLPVGGTSGADGVGTGGAAAAEVAAAGGGGVEGASASGATGTRGEGGTP